MSEANKPVKAIKGFDRDMNVLDPTFTTLADLLAWSREIACAVIAPSEQLAALEDIRRVTMAHAHLLQDEEHGND